MGVYGAWYPRASSRITYELYAVNGFDEGVIEASGDGTRIPEGRGNLTDNNNRPSLVGRLAVSPGRPGSWEYPCIRVPTTSGRRMVWPSTPLAG